MKQTITITKTTNMKTKAEVEVELPLYFYHEHSAWDDDNWIRSRESFGRITDKRVTILEKNVYEKGNPGENYTYEITDEPVNRNDYSDWSDYLTDMRYKSSAVVFEEAWRDMLEQCIPEHIVQPAPSRPPKSDNCPVTKLKCEYDCVGGCREAYYISARHPLKS